MYYRTCCSACGACECVPSLSALAPILTLTFSYVMCVFITYGLGRVQLRTSEKFQISCYPERRLAFGCLKKVGSIVCSHLQLKETWLDETDDHFGGKMVHLCLLLQKCDASVNSQEHDKRKLATQKNDVSEPSWSQLCSVLWTRLRLPLLRLLQQAGCWSRGVLGLHSFSTHQGLPVTACYSWYCCRELTWLVGWDLLCVIHFCNLHLWLHIVQTTVIHSIIEYNKSTFSPVFNTFSTAQHDGRPLWSLHALFAHNQLTIHSVVNISRTTHHYYNV